MAPFLFITIYFYFLNYINISFFATKHLLTPSKKNLNNQKIIKKTQILIITLLIVYRRGMNGVRSDDNPTG